MKKIKLLIAGLFAISVFTGCTANQDNQYGTTDNNLRNVRNNTVNDYQPNTMDGTRFGTNRNITYDDTNRTNNWDNNMNDIRFRNVGTTRTENQNRIEVADRAADRVANLDEVRRANVIVTNRNAYVAVVLDNDPKGTITRDVENKIARAVKQTDRNIENVYVSTNPNFVKRMGDYGDKIGRGEPVEGMFEEFNEMVLRIFPNAR